MSRNSSISSSSARRYLAVTGLVAAVAVCVLGVASIMTLKLGLAQWHFAYLFDYQLQKIRDLPGDDSGIVLLGDSSLGNGISARQWQEITGLRVTSLALTGVYGYAGTLNMLRRVVRRSTPQLVVIVHTAGMMQREVSHQGLLYSADTLSDMKDAPPTAFLLSLVNLDLPLQAVRTLIFGRPAASSGLRERDYIPQGPPTNSPRVETAFSTDSVTAGKKFYLSKIGDLCRTQGLRCVYMHGPYANPGCAKSEAYFRAANAVIRQAGLEVVEDTPVCIAPADVGDAHDHVAEKLRRQYSRLYLEKLEAFLGRKN